jgi:hypothetical protein
MTAASCAGADRGETLAGAPHHLYRAGRRRHIRDVRRADDTGGCAKSIAITESVAIGAESLANADPNAFTFAFAFAFTHSD